MPLSGGFPPSMPRIVYHTLCHCHCCHQGKRPESGDEGVEVLLQGRLQGGWVEPQRLRSKIPTWLIQRETHLKTPGGPKHEIPVDMSQIAATVDAVSSNFFKVLLQTHMKKEEWTIRHLDLSNNLISKVTLSSFAHFHALEILNLSNNAIHSVSLDLPSLKSSWVKRHRSSLRNGLPFLKLLILQRNKLSHIPKGLWKLKSLQSLDLSFNGISQIGLSDFHNCLQLENLHLKSNKIFRIHPEAFKDLKKLQVVDLSNNALTAVLPVMIIALELPHLEADLADNQWQCDYSVAVFHKFISESWREKWNVICNKSIGKEEAYWWTTKRVSRETQLHPTNLNPMKSLLRSTGERPGEARFSTPGKKDPVGSDARERPRRLPRWVKSAGEEQTAGRMGRTPQDLTLAVCLAVFITFFVAFCLGAFARPYVDRLWQQRCRKKSPGSGDLYSNPGFYDEIEAAGVRQQPRMDLHQTSHDQNLHENQNSFWVTEASPYAAVNPERTLAPSRKEPGGRQGLEHFADHTRTKDSTLPYHGGAGPLLHQHSNARDPQPLLAGQDHIYRNEIPGEVNYDTVAQEGALSERSMGRPAAPARSQSDLSSVSKDSDELGPPPPREMTAPLSQMLVHTEALRTGENEGRGGTELSLPEFSKERQVRAYVNSLSAQQQRIRGLRAAGELPTHYSGATLTDPGDTDWSPPASPPGRGPDLPVTPSNKEPVQKHPPDCQYESDTNSDSDEGSLFTLSSTSSEDTRHVSEKEAHGEGSCRASKTLEDEDSGERTDNVTYQNILGKEDSCENQEDRFEKTLTSGPDSGLWETRLESASTTGRSEDPLTLPGSLGSSPCSDAIPGVSVYDYIAALQSEPVEWHCSLRDLEFSNGDIVPQTPPHSAEVSSDSDESSCPDGDADICK
ncbi:leucine-rich repeat-containing protein 66 isoform X1 [Camelus dromedarius]|uniref:leucine-rich repeat-containing protein 66 isoform X1 n=1 Tax=Camelus dromedarius TaxID=9838 RepID=UPI00311A5000